MRSQVVRGFALGIITGSFLTAGGILLAGKADADTDRVVYAYTAQFGSAVCMTLTDFPTIKGAIGIAEAIVEDGLTVHQAGQVLYLSVTEMCPEHTPILRAIANQGRVMA